MGTSWLFTQANIIIEIYRTIPLRL